MLAAAHATRSARSNAVDAVLAPSHPRLVWASGDYAVIGTTLQSVGESLAEAADIRGGEHVLDVAAGNGNAILAAARRFARVTSTDFVPAMPGQGATRAHAERLDVHFDLADADALPYANGEFDAVLSTFGAMFAINHARAASELMRVLKPRGRLGLANWTPNGFCGELFALLGRHGAKSAGTQPAAWGTEANLMILFGRIAHDMRCTRKVFNFRYASAAQWLHVFRTCHGPTRSTFAALDADAAHALERAIIELLKRWNIGGHRTLVVPAEYMEVVITAP